MAEINPYGQTEKHAIKKWGGGVNRGLAPLYFYFLFFNSLRLKKRHKKPIYCEVFMSYVFVPGVVLRNLRVKATKVSLLDPFCWLSLQRIDSMKRRQKPGERLCCDFLCFCLIWCGQNIHIRRTFSWSSPTHFISAVKSCCFSENRNLFHKDKKRTFHLLWWAGIGNFARK